MPSGSSAPPKLRGTRVRELVALQRPDGGWAQTPYLQSDAYATGQVLYTLRQLDVPTADAALQRGTAYRSGGSRRRAGVGIDAIARAPWVKCAGPRGRA